MEYDTFIRHNINIISVVGNDACWTQILREQQNILKDDVACNLRFNSYEKIVNNLDGKGVLISNNDELSKLEEIKKENNTSLLFNILINKTKFREGSLSV